MKKKVHPADIITTLDMNFSQIMGKNLHPADIIVTVDINLCHIIE